MGKFYEGITDSLIPMVRMLAWLNAVPEAPPTPKGPVKRKPPGERKTRLQEMEAKGKDPDLPDVGEAQFLVDYLMEIGPVSPAGMGVDRISPDDILKWEEMTGITLHPWQSRCLRRLSSEYAAESHRATAHDCPPPHLSAPDADERKAIGDALQAAIRSRMAPPQR